MYSNLVYTINNALEEKEREEFTRLKVIKKMQASGLNTNRFFNGNSKGKLLHLADSLLNIRTLQRLTDLRQILRRPRSGPMR